MINTSRVLADESVKEVSLQTIFEEAEVVSLHTPLTQETIGLVNSAFLKRIQKAHLFYQYSERSVSCYKGNC